MSKHIGLGRVLALGLMASPDAASAGAWTLPEGGGLAIVTLTPSQANKGFDEKGKLQSIPRYSKTELQTLLEYGAADWFTVMLAPSLQQIKIAAPVDAQRSGFGYTDIGGRMRLSQGEDWVFSAQATLRVPGTFDKRNPAAIGYTDPELDVRALFGYSFNALGWPAFFDVQLAQRFRIGGPPDEFRADLTLGIQPLPQWLLLAQSFNVISEGAGAPGVPSFSYYKFQVSAVYSVNPALSLQVGAFTTYAGYNALQENGIVLGGWYKF
jgi:hypothetical protein